MSNDCLKAKWKGRCCCNCAFHIEDFHHCTTASAALRESAGRCVCSQHKGWICMPPEIEGAAYSGWTEHGICEMHQFKPNQNIPLRDPYMLTDFGFASGTHA